MPRSHWLEVPSPGVRAASTRHASLSGLRTAQGRGQVRGRGQARVRPRAERAGLADVRATYGAGGRAPHPSRPGRAGPIPGDRAGEREAWRARPEELGEGDNGPVPGASPRSSLKGKRARRRAARVRWRKAPRARRMPAASARPCNGERSSWGCCSCGLVSTERCGSSSGWGPAWASTSAFRSASASNA